MKHLKRGGFGQGVVFAAAAVFAGMVAGPAGASVVDYDGGIFNKKVGSASFSLVHNGATPSGSPILWTFDPNNQPFGFRVDTGADDIFNTGDTITTTAPQTLDLGGGTPAKITLSNLSLTATGTTFSAASGLVDGFGHDISGKTLRVIEGSVDFTITNPAGTTTFFSGAFQFDAIHMVNIFNGGILDTDFAPASIFSAFLWGGAGDEKGSLSNPNQTSIFSILGEGSTDPITGIGIDVAFSADPVPEPAALGLFATGLIALGAARRRRRG